MGEWIFCIVTMTHNNNIIIRPVCEWSLLNPQKKNEQWMLWVEVIINSCCGRGSEYDSKIYDGYIGKSNKNKNGRVGGSQAVIHSFCGELGG